MHAASDCLTVYSLRESCVIRCDPVITDGQQIHRSEYSFAIQLVDGNLCGWRINDGMAVSDDLRNTELYAFAEVALGLKGFRFHGCG